MSTRLKICGITNPQDAAGCVELGVDLLGFNFYSGSPRYISFQESQAIIQEIPSTTKSVGIFVRPKRTDVSEAISQSGVDLVQLFEPEDFSDYAEISVPVIIVNRITEPMSLNFELNGAAMILLDTYTSGELGGSGEVFDWSLIPDSIPRDRLVLAGGITPENVQRAIDQVNPAVIDVASGAEISPGIKDLAKVKRLVEIVKGNS